MNAHSTPTIRNLASEIGLSPMTISLALRNHPKIPKPTRTRVQMLAKSRGYRPDPQVAKLMFHLRTRRERKLQTIIASLTTTNLKTNRYCEIMAEAARLRAAELGFGFDHINMDRYGESPKRLQRVLRSRGIEGVILFPMERPLSCDKLLNWDALSVIATSHTVLSPHFHCVLPDGFGSTQLMCRRLMERGFRRIGMVLSSDMEKRSKHNLSAALLWHNTYGGTQAIKPLITRPGNGKEFRQWLIRERPDVVISQTQNKTEFLKWIKAGTTLTKSTFFFAGLSLRPTDDAAGIVQGEEEIGRTAVDLLASMLQRGEKGIPTCPKLTLIPGLWKDRSAYEELDLSR